MSEKIRVPDIGSGEGEVIELMVKIGDRIETNQSILTLESDKAIMEIPAPKAGVIKSMKVKLGDRLKEGDELFELEVEVEAAAAPAPSGAPAVETIAVGPTEVGSDGSSSVDTPEQRSHTQSMNDDTMNQIDQKLSGIEDRMDKRIDRMEQSEDRRADAYRREQEARDRLYAERFEATNRRLEDRDIVIDSKLDTMNTSIMSAAEKIGEFKADLASSLKAVKESNQSTAQFIVGIIIASVLAFLAINATMIFGAKSFFDSGKEIAALQSSIDDLKKSISSQNPAPSVKPETLSPQPSPKN